MDKLDNETWEEYAFRNNLFVIKYADKAKTVIDDITMPIHTKVSPRHTYPNDYHTLVMYGNNINEIGFMDFIMHEIYNLRDKYKTGCYAEPIQMIVNMTNEHEADINRQKWLFKQVAYWEQIYMENAIEKKEKEKVRLLNTKARYVELKTILSETHKEQLDELLAIIRGSSIPLLEGDVEKYMYSEKYYLEREREKKQKKKERIELYEKYLKNKEIQTQIMELEQKINQLKMEIVK
jgi:hypothetical protein